MKRLLPLINVLKWFAFFSLVLWLGLGCRQADGQEMRLAEAPITTRNTPSARPSLTPTVTQPPTNTPTSTATATATHTATPTPTPTATAVAIQADGDVRAQLLHEPTPKSGARCGVVDVFDFPIDPPDAATVGRGGGDFGHFRSRYDKYHAGEDWGAPAGRQNFGTPVYSIGHGWVSYAQPEGWNRDKGVIIVQHTLADGRVLYSFYGHLDPPSITLEPGECVLRGQQVGNIGRPRTPPHLHFEMRTHLPYQPGPGYWEEDPTTAGWLPPSQTIWTQRMTAVPGVLWSRPATSSFSQPIGIWQEMLLTLADGQIVGQRLADGRELWRWPNDEETAVANALLLAEEALLIIAERSGRVSAFTLADEAVPNLTERWSVAGSGADVPQLLPLPGEGIVTAVSDQLTAYSAEGERLWRLQIDSRPLSWAATDTHLILATAGQDGQLWLLDGTEGVPLPTAVNGHIVGGEQPFIYADDGLYRLDAEAGLAELVYPLATPVSQGDVLALADGSVLIAHTDVDDRRLLLFNAEGSLRWERSFAAVLDGRQQLVVVDDDVYVLSEVRQGSASQVLLHQLDLETAVLTHIFSGGTRAAQPGTWAFAPDADHLAVNIGGGDLLLIVPETAVAAALQPIESD